ncbi:j domain-containing protein 1 [Diutina catenulata]
MLSPRCCCQIGLRRYATAAHEDHHKRLDLHPWPSAKHPSPLDIFAVKTSDLSLPQLEMNQRVKSVYSKYVKLYHPDISKNLVLHDDKGRELTADMKRARFDMVQDAYNILKDPRRRVAYRRSMTTTWDKDLRYGKGFSGTGAHFSYDQRHSFHAFRTANAHRSTYAFDKDEAFWTAGTWDDYYRMKYNRAPPTMEEINKNKYRILAAVVVVSVLAFAIQITLALDKTRENIRKRNLASLQAHRDLQQSYDNYGEGDTQLQRLNRFLVHRRSSLVDSNDEEELRENDHGILTKYAQSQVAKWDEIPPESYGEVADAHAYESPAY